MKRSAFTVWEFLAVIIIVLVMGAILYPAFTPNPEPLRRIACVSNLKQLGLAIVQYAQDNDQCLPNICDIGDGKNTWRVAISPYGKNKQLYQCPSRNGKSDGPDGLSQSYAANYTGNYSGSYSDQGDGAFAGAGSKPINLSEIPDAKKLIALCEVSRHNTPDFNIDNIAIFNPHNRTLWAGHTSTGSYLLADGHAKMYRPLENPTLWHRNPAIPLTPAALTILSDAQKRAGQ